MSQTRLMLIGGFLGAGKTTLLARVATLLVGRGQRVGVITNDQAAELVDTALLRQTLPAVREIAGGCFCCRFGQLIETAEQLVAEMAPDIIIGEPVGSCTDLSATVLQPIKALHAAAYRLTPFSVLVDPHRLRGVLMPRRPLPLHPSASYILRKQLEEADCLVINKRDLLAAAELAELLAAARAAFPGKPVYAISALTGEGVAEWLESLLGDAPAGTHIPAVDYDIYAEGEAVLGWLNAAATVTAPAATDWPAYARAVLDAIRQAAQARGAEIAHVKLTLTAPGGQLAANLTATTGTPVIRGDVPGAPTEVALVLNARVEMAPDALRDLVEEVLRATADGKTLRIATLRTLSPGRPTPTHRYTHVV